MQLRCLAHGKYLLRGPLSALPLRGSLSAHVCFVSICSIRVLFRRALCEESSARICVIMATWNVCVRDWDEFVGAVIKMRPMDSDSGQDGMQDSMASTFRVSSLCAGKSGDEIAGGTED